MDAGAEWVNTFGAECPQNQLGFCDETSQGFLAGMAASGHRVAFDRGDGDAHELDFRGLSEGGEEATVLDSVGIVYFSSHGAAGSDGVFSGYLSTAAGACTWTSTESRLGEGALDYLCLDACDSIEPAADPIATWGASFQGLHLLFGFTGPVSDSPWTSSRGNRFGARAGTGEPLAEAWLDECYSPWALDHPVVMAAGRTPEDAEQRLESERIGGGFDSIPNDEITAFVWKWRE